MKLRGIIASALALALTTSLTFAQTNPGSSPLTIAKGGTNAATAATARTQLGVAIGSNVQAWDADLDALAALSGTNTIYYRSAANTWAAVSIGGLLSFATGTLNVGDAELVALAGLASAADKIPYFTGSGTAALADYTALARTLDANSTAVGMRSTLGVVIGTNVQAWDADLDCIAANSTAGLMAYTGAGTCAYRTLTAPAAGFTITNPAGTAGNPTFVLANDLAALEALGSTGFAVRSAADTWVQRTLQAPAAGLSITNPAGIAGDPTFALANDLAAVEGLASTGIARRTGTDAWSVGTAVTNAELATMAAYTLKGNATGSSAVPTDVSIPALTQKASPVAADKIMIADSAASDALKYATVSSIASAGSVATYNGRTGAVTATGIDVPLRGYLSGLTLSTAGSSATFGIAVGVATDSTSVSMMSLGSAYTKTTSAWALGTAAGSLDTGAIANSTWYHAFLIQRPDTGVVDVLISLSATAPTMPTNYTLFRRIGSMKTNGSAQWTKFIQEGNVFTWDVPVSDVSATNPGTAAVTRTLTTPLGIRVQAKITVTGNGSVAQTDNPGAVLISDLSTTDTVPVAGTGITSFTAYSATAAVQVGGIAYVFTNTSSQVRSRLQLSAGNTILAIATLGWVDTRGRDA